MPLSRPRAAAGKSRPTVLRPKERRIVVHIPRFIIRGRIEFLEQSRFSDFLNGEQSDFILLRGASVFAAESGKLQQSLDELQINKEAITLAYLES